MHQGADKMLSRARKSIWWPFLTSDVKNMADSCLPCQEHKASNPKEGFVHHKQPIFPFQFVHMDLASYEGCQFLICVGFPTSSSVAKLRRQSKSSITFSR
jgi:Integrase zinc binding domain